MRKYIIFLSESSGAEGWEDRKLQHTQALTDILAEYWDSSDQPLPEPGYRPAEYVRVEQFAEAQYPAASTHRRMGDWEVVRVHTYTPEIPGLQGEDFGIIALCYCRYSPINAPLKPMPDREITIDSFGGDKAAYQDWLDAQKQTAQASL